MTSILSQWKRVFNETNSNVIISKWKNIWSIFLCISRSTSSFEYFEKNNEPGRLFVSEIIDYKKRCYLNAEKGAYQNTYGQLKC